MVVVKVSGLPILCKTDEIGEICVQSTASGSAYWGLQGKSTHTFRVCSLLSISISYLDSYGIIMYKFCNVDLLH